MNKNKYHYINFGRVPQLGDIFRTMTEKPESQSFKYQVVNIVWKKIVGTICMEIYGMCIEEPGKGCIDKFYNTHRLILLSFNNQYISFEQLSMFVEA